jgi:hypothetical protein
MLGTPNRPKIVIQKVLHRIIQTPKYAQGLYCPMRSITDIYVIILHESMPLWIKDGIGTPGGGAGYAIDILQC